MWDLYQKPFLNQYRLHQPGHHFLSYVSSCPLFLTAEAMYPAAGRIAFYCYVPGCRYYLPLIKPNCLSLNNLCNEKCFIIWSLIIDSKIWHTTLVRLTNGDLQNECEENCWKRVCTVNIKHSKNIYNSITIICTFNIELERALEWTMCMNRVLYNDCYIDLPTPYNAYNKIVTPPPYPFTVI